MTLKYPDVIALTWCSTTVISFLVCMTVQVRQLAIEEPARRTAAFSIREVAEGSTRHQPAQRRVRDRECQTAGVGDRPSAYRSRRVLTSGPVHQARLRPTANAAAYAHIGSLEPYN